MVVKISILSPLVAGRMATPTADTNRLPVTIPPWGGGGPRGVGGILPRGVCCDPSSPPPSQGSPVVLGGRHAVDEQYDSPCNAGPPVTSHLTFISSLFCRSYP